jgi:hypothetical protein
MHAGGFGFDLVSILSPSLAFPVLVTFDVEGGQRGFYRAT